MLARRKGGRYGAATVKISVARQNGKNGIVEVRELFGMIALGEKFLHTAHEVKTARKAFKRIASFFENEKKCPELAAMVKEIRKTNGQEAILLKCRDCLTEGEDDCRHDSGGSVEFIARSKGSGRGFTVDVLVLDEDQDLTDEELEALLPTISSAPLGNPQIIMTGTPPDPDKPDAEQGEVARRVRKEAQEGTDPNLLCMDWGVGFGPLPDVDDVKLWHETNPALGIRLHIQELHRERKLMSPESFARERLGWWGNPAARLGGLFGPGRWASLGVAGIQPVTILGFGIAVSLDGEWASIAACGEAEDGRRVIGVAERQPGTDWVVNEVLRLGRKYEVEFGIDEKCPEPMLLSDLEESGAMVTQLTLAGVAEAASQMRVGVKTKAFVHGNHPDLDGAVERAAWRMVGDQKIFGRKQSDGSIDMLEAGAIAYHMALESESVYESRGLVTV